MKAELVLWVGLLVVLFLLFLLTLRRLSVLIARTRDLERVQRSVDSIDRRFAIAIGPIVNRLDEIRRRSGDPLLLARELDPARTMLEDLAAETRKLRVPAVLAGQAAVMVHEMDRALRATELVGHGLDALLADNAVFLSPVVHTPQAGKALTRAYLMAAFQVFSNETFRYVREIKGPRDAVLEFQVEIDGIQMNGVDMIKWDDDGKIVEFKVMLRPLKAVNLIHQKMGAMLQRMQ